MTTDVRERFTFRIPKRLMQMLRNEAKEKGVSVNALILQILWQWIELDNQQKGA